MFPTMRCWAKTCGLVYAAGLRRKSSRPTGSWASRQGGHDDLWWETRALAFGSDGCTTAAKVDDDVTAITGKTHRHR